METIEEVLWNVNRQLKLVIEKVTDISHTMDIGVIIPLALAIDGRVKSAGKILSRDQITAYLEKK